MWELTSPRLRLQRISECTTLDIKSRYDGNVLPTNCPIRDNQTIGRNDAVHNTYGKQIHMSHDDNTDSVSKNFFDAMTLLNLAQLGMANNQLPSQTSFDTTLPQNTFPMVTLWSTLPLVILINHTQTRTVPSQSLAQLQSTGTEVSPSGYTYDTVSPHRLG